MIRKVDMYQCVCDRCGKPFEDGFHGFAAWTDEESAECVAMENGWETIGGKHYCPDCCEYDEETDSFSVKRDKKEE